MSAETLRNMLIKQEPRSVSVCYVCAGTRADYPLFSKPIGDRPFFPFLEHHTPPESAEGITLDGCVLVCSLCCTFLNQQWEAYERTKTPHSKRIYWLKRLDNGPFAGMEVNLQQDYESLFDGSHLGEREPQHKHRQSKSFQASMSEVKRSFKLSERSESRDSSVSSMSGRCEKLDVTSTCVNNALDLSMPSRTPSQSSTSSLSDLESCYVCGSTCKILLNIFAKPISNCPFFPSLLHHMRPANSKPMDENGKVRSCEKCHKNLLQQWDFCQQQNIPHSKRSYDLKLFVTSTVPAISVAKLEPTLHDKSYICFTCGMAGQTSIQRVIRSFPEKAGDSYFSFLSHITPYPGSEPLLEGKAKVCSLCYKSLYRQLRVYELSSVPEDERKYKIHSNSSSEDFSVLRQHLKSNSLQRNPLSRSVCYMCEKASDYPILISTFPNGDMYFPFIAGLSKPPGGEHADEGGYVKVCCECHASLKFQWDAFEHAKIPITQRQYKISRDKAMYANNYMSLEFQNSVNFSIRPSSSSSSSEAFAKRESTHGNTCCLCSRLLVEENVKVIETLPRQDCMYFPFIRSYLKLDDMKQMDQFGRVLVCGLCYSLLKNQWDLFDTACVPHIQRQYRILPPVPEKDRESKGVDSSQDTNTALHVQVSSPDFKVNVCKSTSNLEPLLTTVNTMVMSNVVTSSAQLTEDCHDKLENHAKVLPNQLDTKPVLHDSGKLQICGPFDVLFGRPLKLSAICFVCAETSASAPMYTIHSQPYDNTPFFPFLAKHPVPDGAEKLSEDGSALVCILCYHSLMSQYLAYEASPHAEDANCWHRKYNAYNYVCYVCGVTANRKQTFSVAVRDFPFLPEHPRPPGALTLLNGEYVVTCVTCFDSLMAQCKDFEHLKIPVSSRKYKLTISSHGEALSERHHMLDGREPHSSSHLAGEESQGSHASSSSSSAELKGQGLPHGGKPPPPPHVPVQTLYSSKPSSRAMPSASPIHPNASFSRFDNGSSSALNAARTSSFAAALRKLAKQAVDPVAEREVSPIPVRSPALNQQQSSGPKQLTAAASSVYLNSHHASLSSSSSSLSSAPVSVGAVQSHAPYALDTRKGSDYGRYSASSTGSSSHGADNISFQSEYSASANNRDDRRGENMIEVKPSPLYGSRQQLSSREEHGLLSRGFQPYRNSDESLAPAASHVYDTPSGGVSSGYSSHQPFPSHSVSQPYRSKSEDNLRENSSRTRDRSLEEEHQQREDHLARERGQSGSSANESALDHKNRTIYSPLALQANRSESPHNETSRLGPGQYGSTHHDLLFRKQSPPSSSVPLNLVKHATPASAFQDEMSAWNSKHAPTSNSQKYSNTSHHKNGYDSSLEERSLPPPLIPEGHHELQIQRSIQKLDDPNRNYSPYSKSGTHYHGKDYPKSSTPQYSDSHSHVNGIVSQESYGYQNVQERKGGLKHPRDVYSHFSAENRSENKLESKVVKITASLQTHDSWTYRNAYTERLQRPVINSDDPYGNNTSYMDFVDKPFALDASSSKPQQYATKDASITRALLQNHITPSIIERYVHSSEEPVRNVSKLDLRETRLRKLRLVNGDSNYELSDSESDEEEELRRREFLIIMNVWPLPFEAKQEKLNFLSAFGLTTHPKRQLLDWRKYLKRKRMQRERSRSPVDEGEIVSLVYDSERLKELSQRLCIEDSSETKTEFLKLLNLVKKSGLNESVKPAEDRKLSVTTSTIVENFYEDQPCQDLPESHYKKRRTLLGGMWSSNAKKNDVMKNQRNGLISKDITSVKQNIPSLRPSQPPTLHVSPFTKNSSKSIASLPPLIPVDQSLTGDQSSTTGKAIVSSQDPRVKLLNKSFAQEFHESVLQATQMQLGQKVNSSLEPELIRPSMPQSETAHSLAGENQRSIFRWPGIEAVMESYECYISELNNEKDFLMERCQKLRACHQELNAQIVCLGQKTSELMQQKTSLDSERQTLQTAIDNFKTFIHHFR